MIARLRLPLVLILAACLPGCAALSALTGATEVLEVYELRTPRIAASGPARRGIELIVEEPGASGALSTERILVRPTPLNAQYLPGVRWADTTPVMVQTLLVRSLTDVDRFGSVGRRPVGPLADFALLGELTDFQVEPFAEAEGGHVHMRLVLRLVRESDARVVATRTFAVRTQAAGSDIAALLTAFDGAVAALMGDIVPWVLARTDAALG